MSNTLAYYYMATITLVISFIIQAPGGPFTHKLKIVKRYDFDRKFPNFFQIVNASDSVSF